MAGLKSQDSSRTRHSVLYLDQNRKSRGNAIDSQKSNSLNTIRCTCAWKPDRLGSNSNYKPLLQCESIFNKIFAVDSYRCVFYGVECAIADQGHLRSLTSVSIESAYAILPRYRPIASDP